jgi:hypothetical protein
VKKRVLWISLILLSVIVFIFIVKVIFVSEEEKIERIIHAGKKAFEKEDPELIMGFLSREYQDDLDFDYNGIRQGLYDVFSLFDGIKVNMSKLEVEVTNGEATVKLSLWILAKSEDQTVFLLGSFNNYVPGKVNLQKEEGEWKIIRFSLSSPKIKYQR